MPKLPVHRGELAVRMASCSSADMRTVISFGSSSVIAARVGAQSPSTPAVCHRTRSRCLIERLFETTLVAFARGSREAVHRVRGVKP